MSSVVILNPKSRGGRAARTWEKVRSRLPPSEVLKTNAPGHAIELTRAALKRDAKTVIVVGGDGTINEVVNGFFDAGTPIAPDAILGIVPHGSGSDFRRVLNLPADETAAAEIINTGVPRRIDIMKVRYARLDGSPDVRYAVNLTSFGMGGTVASRANRSSKPFGGRAAFIAATLLTTLGFRGCQVRLTLDESGIRESRITNVAVGNGQYHGGGMRVCPRAVLDDGFLDVTIIGHLSLFETIRDLPLLYNGRIYEHPKVEFHRVKRIRAESRDPALIEIDGEPLGKLPIEIELVPQAIRILMPGF